MVGTVKQSVRWALSHGLPSVVMRRQAARGDIQGRLVSQGGAWTPRPWPPSPTRSAPTAPCTAAPSPTSPPPCRRSRRCSPATTSAPGCSTRATGCSDGWARWAEEPGRLGPLTPPSLLVTEPPDHTRYRKLVTRVFTARAVEGLRVRTQEIADELLDGLDPSDPVELVSTYCSRLPVTVIAEILGVPAAGPRAGAGVRHRRRARASTSACRGRSSATSRRGSASSRPGWPPTWPTCATTRARTS